MNLYGFAGGDPVNFTDPFGLCWWDGCIAEGAAASYVGGAIAATAATYLATHPEHAAALANALSGASAEASETWDGFKKKVTRIGTIGAIGVLAWAGGIKGPKPILDILKAKAEAEAKRKAADDELKRRKEEAKKGTGGSGDPPPDDSRQP